MRKIDTFYRAKNGVHYLHSSNSFKTCKAATESTRNMKPYELKTYENKTGEPINMDNIFSRFDNNYTRHDNMPR